MRYLQAALVGLFGGFLLTAGVIAVEVLLAAQKVSSEVANCTGDGGSGGCASYAAVGGGIETLAAFVIGFIAASAWFLRRRRVIAP